MEKNLYVVTSPDSGWDCVVGIYKASSEEIVREYFNTERGRDTEDNLIIHMQWDITELD